LEERSNQIVELCSRVTELTETNQQLQEESQQACSDRQESADQLLKVNESMGRLKVQVEELSEELNIWEQRCYKAEVRLILTPLELGLNYHFFCRNQQLLPKLN
jgi:predicted  nucleic acid-binding Zn-ribbon protein